MSDRWPSIKARALVRILEREPCSCELLRQEGSHRRYRSATGQTFTFSYHDSVTVTGSVVRKILVRDVGLDADVARDLL